MTTPNTIFLKGDLGRRYEEAIASGIVKPGYLLKMDGDSKVLAHATRGGKSERLFAIEDALQGRLTTDAYAVGEIVRFVCAAPGEVLLGVLHDGENVDEGDYLISRGDGTLVKAASAVLANIVAPSTAVTAATLTAFSNGTATIPANTLQAGDRVRFQVLVTYPTASNSTDTAVITIKLGSTTIVATAALDYAAGDNTLIDGFIEFRTVGASGTLVAWGQYTQGVPGTGTGRDFHVLSTAVDTTAALVLTSYCTLSATNANNQAIQQVFIVEKIGSSTSAGGSASGEIIATCVEATNLTSNGADGFVRIRVMG